LTTREPHHVHQQKPDPDNTNGIVREAQYSHRFGIINPKIGAEVFLGLIPKSELVIDGKRR
jgi:hypothetical protein